MVGNSSSPPSSPSSSSISSCVSIASFDDVSVGKSSNTVKFLCSYGGKILPRYPDGKLRYVGGETRVLTVDRSVPFSDLLVKMGELCGGGLVSLRCQIPTEDLDALVTVTSDEDLANLVEEYDLAGLDRKIRAFLYPSPSKSSKGKSSTSRPPLPMPMPMATNNCVHHQISTPTRTRSGMVSQRNQYHHRHQYPVHHGNHWQQ